MVGALVLAAAAAPWLTPYDPDAIVVMAYRGPLGPGNGHLFGTDTVGRDVWARVPYGARTSLFVGTLAMAISLVIGMAIGLAAGYFGGLVDAVLMWVAAPGLAIAMACVGLNLIGYGLIDLLAERRA